MRRRFVLPGCAAFLLLLAAAQAASAININVVYPASNMFQGYEATAKAAINAAAADLSAAITSNLSAITTDAYTGSVSGTTATLGWEFYYLDPSTSSNNVFVPTATIAANTVTMHVGARSILGTTLGLGGPGGVSLDLDQFTAGGSPNQWVAAVAEAEDLSETAYRRGGGPVIGVAEGSGSYGSNNAIIAMPYTISHGFLSLDWDGNNNGAKDSDSQLNAYWHFDHTTPVATGKNDLYSVALHEMMHAIGIGASDTWDSKLSGTSWTGSNVIALQGSGAGLINGAGDHIASGVMSTRISDGAAQEAVMDPTLTQGSRKSLTALDLAFLRDIGYTTITPTPVFNPADFNEDGDVDSADLLIWQSAYGVNPNGDTDNDGDSDGRDFLFWQRAYTGPGPLTAAVAVPEPSTILLLASVLLLSGRRLR